MQILPFNINGMYVPWAKHLHAEPKFSIHTRRLALIPRGTTFSPIHAHSIQIHVSSSSGVHSRVLISPRETWAIILHNIEMHSTTVNYSQPQSTNLIVIR